MNSYELDEWGWKCRGEPLNTNTIIAWARVWNFVEFPNIPSIEVTELREEAHIRVQFSGNHID